MPIPNVMNVTFRNDDGISMAEVMVSIVILAIALTALAGTLTTALAQVSEDEQFTRANQAGSQVLEGLRNLDWDLLGFYSSDPGYAATATDGAQTVTLSGSRPGGGSPAPLPEDTIVVDGVTYATDLDVVWQDDPNQPPGGGPDPDPRDYKQMRLSLTWQLRGQAFETTLVADRQPTVAEVPVDAPVNCLPGEIVDYDISPQFVTLGLVGETQEAIVVTVETCTESSTASLTPQPFGSRPMVDSGDGKVWTYTFPIGTNSFDPGEYVWSVDTFGVDGGDTAADFIQFAEASEQLLQVISTSVTPSPTICVATNNRTHFPVVIDTHITGATASDSVSVSWTSRAGSAPATYTGNDASGNGKFRATIPQGHTFNSTTTTITVSVTRTEDGLNVSESYVIDIFKINNSSGCP